MFSSNCFGNLVVIFHYKSNNSVLRRSHRSGEKKDDKVCKQFRRFVLFFWWRIATTKKTQKIFKIFSRWLNRMECGQYSKQDTKLQTNLWIARSGFFGTGDGDVTSNSLNMCILFGCVPQNLLRLLLVQKNIPVGLLCSALAPTFSGYIPNRPFICTGQPTNRPNVHRQHDGGCCNVVSG